MKIQNILNRTVSRQQLTEKNSGRSLTIPDQSLSVKEIMIRNQRGLPLSGIKAVFHDEKFLDDESGRNPASMDITEIVAELQKIEARVKERNEAFLRTQEEKRKKAQEMEEQRKKEEWIKEWKAQFQPEGNDRTTKQ